MYKIIFLLIVIVLTFSCYSRDGLFDTEECSSQRNSEHAEYNQALVLLAANQCWSITEKNYNACANPLIFMLDGAECGQPGIPYPWYKKKKDHL